MEHSNRFGLFFSSEFDQPQLLDFEWSLSLPEIIVPLKYEVNTNMRNGIYTNAQKGNSVVPQVYAVMRI